MPVQKKNKSFHQNLKKFKMEIPKKQSRFKIFKTYIKNNKKYLISGAISLSLILALIAKNYRQGKSTQEVVTEVVNRSGLPAKVVTEVVKKFNSVGTNTMELQIPPTQNISKGTIPPPPSPESLENWLQNKKSQEYKPIVKGKTQEVSNKKNEDLMNELKIKLKKKNKLSLDEIENNLKKNKQPFNVSQFDQQIHKGIQLRAVGDQRFGKRKLQKNLNYLKKLQKDLNYLKKMN